MYIMLTLMWICFKASNIILTNFIINFMTDSSAHEFLMTTKCTITLTLPPLYDSMAQQFEVFKPFGSEQVTQLSNNT